MNGYMAFGRVFPTRVGVNRVTRWVWHNDA